MANTQRALRRSNINMGASPRPHATCHPILTRFFPVRHRKLQLALVLDGLTEIRVGPDALQDKLLLVFAFPIPPPEWERSSRAKRERVRARPSRPLRDHMRTRSPSLKAMTR